MTLFQINKWHGSFIGWLTSSRNKLPAEESLEFASRTYKAIKDLVRTRIESLGLVLVSKIQSDILRSPQGFVSENLLKRIFLLSDEFQLIASKIGVCAKLVKGTVPCNESDVAKNVDKATPMNFRTKQLVFLFAHHPHVVVALTKYLTWDLISQCHPVWWKYYSESSTTLVDWLLDISRCMSENTFGDYQQALTSCVLGRALVFIKYKKQSVAQVASFLCQSHPRLVAESFVFEILKHSEEFVSISHAQGQSAEEAVVELKMLAGNDDESLLPERKHSTDLCKQAPPSVHSLSDALPSEERKLWVATDWFETPNGLCERDKHTKAGVKRSVDVKGNVISRPSKAYKSGALEVESTSSRPVPVEDTITQKQFALQTSETANAGGSSLLSEENARQTPLGCVSFDVPSSVQSMLSRTLSPSVNCRHLLKLFSLVREKEPLFVQQVVSEFGSFCGFLLKYVNDQSTCISVSVTTLHTQLKWLISDVLRACTSKQMRRDELFKRLNDGGDFIDSVVFLRTLNSDPCMFCVDGESVVATSESPYAEKLPTSADEHESLLSFIANSKLETLIEQVTFEQLAAEYARLPPHVKQFLTKNRLSFFDGLHLIVKQKADFPLPDHLDFNSQLLDAVRRCVEATGPASAAQVASLLSGDNKNLVSEANVKACLDLPACDVRCVAGLLGPAVPPADTPRPTSPPTAQNHSITPRSVRRFIDKILATFRTDRLSHLKHFLRTLPSGVARDVLSRHGTFYRFVAECSDAARLDEVIVDEAVSRLGSDTVSVEELAARVGGAESKLFDLKDFTAIIKKEKCVLIGHPVRGNLACVKRVEANGEAMFFDDAERDCVSLLLSCIGNNKSVLFSELFEEVLNISTLTEAQRFFFFGETDSTCCSSSTAKVVYFCRIFLMFPSVFTLVGEDSVSLNRVDDGLSRCLTNEVSSSLEADDDIRSGNDEEKKTRPMPLQTSSKSIDSSTRRSSEECDSNSPPVKRRRVHSHEHCDSDSVVLSWDLCADRGLPSAGEQQALAEDSSKSEIVENLTAFVIDEALQCVLSAKLTEAVKLRSKSSRGESSSTKLSCAFKTLSQLTRVSDKTLKECVSRQLTASNQPLPVETLVRLIRQEFVKPDTICGASNDALQCQVLSCLKWDPKYVLDITNGAVCFATNCRRQPTCEKSSVHGIEDEEISQFIVKYLEVRGQVVCVCFVAVNMSHESLHAFWPGSAFFR